VAGTRGVARAAASLLPAGGVTILDGGSTALALAEALLPGFTGTFVTHSPPAAAALAAHEGVEVVMVGGTLERRAMVAVGAQTIEAYRSIAADVLFLGVWSLHADHGLSEGYHEEAEVRRVLLGRADRVVGLATADKLGTVAPFGYGPATALTHLVTERGTDDATLRPFTELGIAVVR
jgi:DeoR/GlpR family transcriptional regulator of sugar metabolism